MVNVIEQPAFQHAWSVVERALSIKTEHDYKRAVALLDQLLDTVGEDAHHPLFNYLDVLGTLIENYEDDHIKLKGATAVEVLQLLIAEHHLAQSDLPEMGTQGVVSEILHGERSLNVRQISALSERFGVSPAVFF